MTRSHCNIPTLIPMSIEKIQSDGLPLPTISLISINSISLRYVKLQALELIPVRHSFRDLCCRFWFLILRESCDWAVRSRYSLAPLGTLLSIQKRVDAIRDAALQIDKVPAYAISVVDLSFNIFAVLPRCTVQVTNDLSWQKPLTTPHLDAWFLMI
ncbi:hypothetical protein Mal48_17260 [Thalassoglobus polymorphus]|uniref:Uncharacterized protein n=1 Tax=Thalassoglobus polymorphus TaxID=2527994 RepID=A0A517QLF6_9PLAN|nr:hypothetical protein Mal48_17260 [Thalassoglobus polymorphus]